MYFTLSFFTALLLFWFFLRQHQKKKMIQKICTMSLSQKCRILNELLEPLGFHYNAVQDLFLARTNTSQQALGYSSFYDETALFQNMVLDCEPIYFDYDNRTWLIEFWKGQYGIYTGGQIGLYCTDTVISKELHSMVLFHRAPAPQYLYTNLRLLRGQTQLYDITQKLSLTAGFCIAQCYAPEELILEAAITFPSYEMMQAFLAGFTDAGYAVFEYIVFGLTVSFTFWKPKAIQPRDTHILRAHLTQLRMKYACRLYVWITKPFFRTPDRMLYLSYRFPSIFLRITRTPATYFSSTSN